MMTIYEKADELMHSHGRNSSMDFYIFNKAFGHYIICYIILLFLLFLPSLTLAIARAIL